MTAPHNMHQNSLDAYASLDLSHRKKQILTALINLGGTATDRQVAEAMGSGDPNMARPRITEMLREGLIIEIGNVKDERTGRNVRQVQIVNRQSDDSSSASK